MKAIFALVTTITALSVGPLKAVEVEAPEVIAVKFHADWCGSCKVMGPVFEELQAKFDTQSVLYIVLDHTRTYNRRQSQYLVTTLGLDKVWAEYGGKTGFILLIDGESRKVLNTLTRENNLKQMGASLLAAVEHASANN